MSHLLRLGPRYPWIWVSKWGVHKCVGILSMLSVSEVWENELYFSFTQNNEYYTPVVELSWVHVSVMNSTQHEIFFGRRVSLSSYSVVCTLFCRNLHVVYFRIKKVRVRELPTLLFSFSIVFIIRGKTRIKENTYKWVSV